MAQSNGKHFKGLYVIFLSSVNTVHLNRIQQPQSFEGQKYVSGVSESCHI